MDLDGSARCDGTRPGGTLWWQSSWARPLASVEMQDYHNLRVWRHAVALAVNTRRVVSGFPRHGYARLKAQMVDAAESIVDNVVEGCGAATQPELARFLDMAIKSACELEGQYDIAYKYRVIAAPEHRARSADTIDTRRMLFGFRKKVLESLE